MVYSDVIETIGAIVENDLIYKKGLILPYVLSEGDLNKIDEEFYESMNNEGKFRFSDQFEVKIGELVVKFVKIDT